MRRTIAPALLVSLALTACAGGEDGEGSPDPGEWQQGEGPAPSPTEETTEDGTFVFNRYQDEAGYPDERPETFVATEFTSFAGMDWDEWTDTAARGSGTVAGTWCLNLDCDEDPYPVDVELGEPVEVDGVTYFSTYEVTDAGDMPEDVQEGMEAADNGRLTVPTEGGPDGQVPEEAPEGEDDNGGDDNGGDGGEEENTDNDDDDDNGGDDD